LFFFFIWLVKKKGFFIEEHTKSFKRNTKIRERKRNKGINGYFNPPSENAKKYYVS